MKIIFLETGHMGYQKIKNFMLISKMQTYLGDKMPPKKVKIKKRQKIGTANLEDIFLILTFFGGILSLRQVCFFEISLKFSIF